MTDRDNLRIRNGKAMTKKKRLIQNFKISLMRSVHDAQNYYIVLGNNNEIANLLNQNQ